MTRWRARSTLFPYTTLCRSLALQDAADRGLLPATDIPWLVDLRARRHARRWARQQRSEEHTSELQSRRDLVCRLLLEKKNYHRRSSYTVPETHHYAVEARHD